VGTKTFFNTIDHNLMMRAIETHVSVKWIQLDSISGVGWGDRWCSAGRCDQSVIAALCLCLGAVVSSSSPCLNDMLMILFVTIEAKKQKKQLKSY